VNLIPDETMKPMLTSKSLHHVILVLPHAADDVIGDGVTK
jgi:hypothetical protein